MLNKLSAKKWADDVRPFQIWVLEVKQRDTNILKRRAWLQHSHRTDWLYPLQAHTKSDSTTASLFVCIFCGFKVNFSGIAGASQGPLLIVVCIYIASPFPSTTAARAEHQIIILCKSNIICKIISSHFLPPRTVLGLIRSIRSYVGGLIRSSSLDIKT